LIANWLPLCLLSLLVDGAIPAFLDFYDAKFLPPVGPEATKFIDKVTTGLLMAATFALGFISSGLMVYFVLAKDMRLPNSAQILARKLAPILILSAISTLGTALGAVLLLVPGLYLLVVWSLAVPALLCENIAPTKSLGRSLDLITGYFVPVSALLIAGMMAAISLSWAGEFLGEAAEGITGIGPVGSLINFTISSFGSVAFVVMQAALYLRLRLLKEGPQTDDVATVFD
jgi:hypothetical protein